MLCCGHGDEAGEFATLNTDRAASEFEALRLETEHSGKRPKAFMLTIGNLAMRQARAQFSCNFLACAGYEVIDNLGFPTVEEGIEVAMKANADIVVLCSSDDEYAEYAIPGIQSPERPRHVHRSRCTGMYGRAESRRHRKLHPRSLQCIGDTERIQ